MTFISRSSFSPDDCENKSHVKLGVVKNLHKRATVYSLQYNELDQSLAWHSKPFFEYIILQTDFHKYLLELANYLN